MTERRFYLEHNVQNVDVIEGDEFNHLRNVLRLNVGDNVTVVCGDGYDYHCQITNITKKLAEIKLLDKVKNNNDPVLKITLFLGLVKNDSFSSITTRMSELGVSNIIPFSSQYCGVKTTDVKIEKMQKVANMAIKQCDMSTPLKVHQVLPFNSMLQSLNDFDEVYFAYESQLANNINMCPQGKNIAVVIGPIGGFSPAEAEQIAQQSTVKSVSLGRRIMRVETACASLVAVLMCNSGEWKI